MRNIDFTSWSGAATTLLGLILVSLVAVGIRLVFMQTIQRRRERENRQINERLKTLIAAYKTLGGSFTGNLEVDPSHGGPRGRAQAQAQREVAAAEEAAEVEAVLPVERALPESVAERRRRIRDAVEAALSDVILLGTEEQVRLAAQAAQDMVAGRVVLVGPLVNSLRDFIRQALDLDPMPSDVVVPAQGPARPAAAGGGRAGVGAQGGAAGAGRNAGGGGGAGGGAMAGGAGMGMGFGAMGLHRQSDAATPNDRPES
jgi:heme exporter protein D